MSLYSITGAHLAFGHVALLDQADFSIDEGERVGLIGRNGAGKSSLLKIIAGLAQADDAHESRQQGLKTVYVAQEPEFETDATVFDAVATGLGAAHRLLREFEAVSQQLADGTPHGSPSEGSDGAEAGHDALFARMSVLQSELDACNGWMSRNRVEATLAQLGLQPELRVDALSGGLRKRVALARALVAEPDLLLLDEPTNHLDFEAIRWLETLLVGLRTSLIFITHDRAFLDRVATRIVELDRGRLLSYPGNFSAYQIRKAQQLEVERVENEKFDKMLAQEEVWIRKGVEARRTRSVGRVERLHSMRAERASRRVQQDNVKLDVSHADRSGKIVAELIDVSKHYGERTVISHFSATVMRGDKIGLIGPNGAGKTTLIKLILGQIAPDQGSVRSGTKVEPAYFDQMRAQLDPERTLADTISPGSEWIEINGARKHVMSYLGDFLFSPQRALSPVKSLSGGERNRLLLARLFARASNVLVLDEPTNDLDIPTLELLEELLTEYSGTVLLVSHDRAFLDDVVTSVIAAEGEGEWREYVGGFSDWQTQSERSSAMRQAGARESSTGAARSPARTAAAAAPPAAGAAQTPRQASRPVRLSFKEQRELEALPGQIAALEAEQKSLSAQIEEGRIFAGDADEARRVTDRFAAIDEELFAALERWELLETKAKGA